MPDQTTTDTAAEIKRLLAPLVAENDSLRAEIGILKAKLRDAEAAQDLDDEADHSWSHDGEECTACGLRASAWIGEGCPSAHSAPTKEPGARDARTQPDVWRENGRWCWRTVDNPATPTDTEERRVLLHEDGSATVTRPGGYVLHIGADDDNEEPDHA